jgi:hypothetical protein
LEAGSVPPSLNFPQLDFVEPSSGFHPVTWERVTSRKKKKRMKGKKRKNLKTKKDMKLMENKKPIEIKRV